MAQIAKLPEIRESWTIKQVFEYNEMLDLQDETELKAAESRKDALDSIR